MFRTLSQQSRMWSVLNDRITVQIQIYPVCIAQLRLEDSYPADGD